MESRVNLRPTPTVLRHVSPDEASEPTTSKQERQPADPTSKQERQLAILDTATSMATANNAAHATNAVAAAGNATAAMATSGDATTADTAQS